MSLDYFKDRLTLLSDSLSNKLYPNATLTLISSTPSAGVTDSRTGNIRTATTQNSQSVEVRVNQVSPEKFGIELGSNPKQIFLEGRCVNPKRVDLHQPWVSTKLLYEDRQSDFTLFANISLVHQKAIEGVLGTPFYGFLIWS